MNILIIGNGFDLAHGLPTKYTDFLKWTVAESEFFEDLKNQGDTRIANDIVVKLEIPENKKREQDICKWIEKQIELWGCINNNIWIEYFLQCNMYQKENWIDFEREISKLIQQLDRDMKFKEKQRFELNNEMMELSNEFLSKKYSKYTVIVQSMTALTDGKCETITFGEIRDRLYTDLNRLTRALEIYLTQYIGKMEIKLTSPDIEELVIKQDQNQKSRNIISYVLTFNYSNTYEKYYLERQTGLVDIYMDYIHGKADICNTIETNNMVLGIEEYLSDEGKNIETEFIAFKKFYQRIHKETGCKYKNWIEDIRDEYEEFIQRKIKAQEREHMYTTDSMQKVINRLAASAVKDEKCKKHNLYIFGHSLDVTDGDILRDLILNDNVYTTIYYLNKDVMGQQIANLVKVIGQDELIRRTGGSTKTIEFKLQQDMIEKGAVDDVLIQKEIRK